MLRRRGRNGFPHAGGEEGATKYILIFCPSKLEVRTSSFFVMPERVNKAEDYPEGKYANRSLVRTVVFQILYQEELNPGSRETFSESYMAQELPRHEPLRRFARQLLDSTLTHREAIDERLTALSQNWTLARMSPVDRSILRLSAAEILYTDTPKPIVINEAIELAKKFGTKDSAAFVNGILDRMQR